MLTIEPGVGPSQSVLIGLGILAAFAYLLVMSPRAGLSRTDVLAAVGISGVVGAVGSRVAYLVIRVLHGHDIFKGGVAAWFDPGGAGHNSLGFLAGATLGLWVWTAVQETNAHQDDERWRMLDVMAPAGLLALALARIGCLFNGCDFGRVADVPWAVRFAAPMQAWQHHHARGLVGLNDALSLPTHPFALYLGTGMLVIVAWVTLAGRFERARPGTRALWTVGLFLVLALPAEATREAPGIFGSKSVFHLYHLVLVCSLALLVSVACRRWAKTDLADGRIHERVVDDR